MKFKEREKKKNVSFSLNFGQDKGAMKSSWLMASVIRMTSFKEEGVIKVY